MVTQMLAQPLSRLGHQYRTRKMLRISNGNLVSRDQRLRHSLLILAGRMYKTQAAVKGNKSAQIDTRRFHWLEKPAKASTISQDMIAVSRHIVDVKPKKGTPRHRAEEMAKPSRVRRIPSRFNAACAAACCVPRSLYVQRQRNASRE
jgi:hypothetical protein